MLGRQTSSTYDADGHTVLQVRQTSGGASDVLATYATFTALHQPQAVTDAAGQTTTLTYNAAGQVLTVTNARSETTTSTYDADGRLLTVTGPVSGSTTTYGYDLYGRLRTVTDAEGYAVTTDYDLFDRPVRVTYPDGTYEETTSDRLDVSTRRDRAGRITRYFYDPVRRLIATRDPLGRTIRQDWCTCGALDALVDANGNRTTWERDLQARVTREVRADGTTATVYTYEPRSGRLATITDPKGQVTTHSYALDNALLSVNYSNAQIPTPGVTYTYDAVYGRLTTMSDGIGLTAYTYHPAGQLGAGQVASVDGPLTNDTITYSYDELGRVTTRAINGAANTVTWAFDALGRVTSEANVLGTFSYTYDGPTSRIATVAYPNGQLSEYSYFGNTGDRRLQTIHHKYPTGATLSKFDYTYDAVGNITTWRQQADATAVLWRYAYDQADQLVAALKETTDGTPVVLKRYAYAYDPAGNRTAEQIDDQVTGASYDGLNRLVSQQAAGPLVFEGTVNEPASVTVQGEPAAVGADGRFSAKAPVSSGTNTVSILASDPSGNATTRQSEVDSFGSGRTFTYDANGNLTSDGTRTFEWDARNQLVAVTLSTRRSEFRYDGLKRRVHAVEKENGIVQSDTDAIWCGTAICEEWAANGVTVVRRTFTRAEQVAEAARYFATDHLGSVTDLADSAGALLGRYAYDPWGRRALTAGADMTGEGFTGHRWHSSSSLLFALYRGYDPDLGRWLNQDPIGLAGGLNMYVYVLGAPVRFTDPLGLKISCDFSFSFKFGLPKTYCGTPGCTYSQLSAPSASDCEPDKQCGGYKFNGRVSLSVVVEFSDSPMLTSKDTPGESLGGHELLHLNDWQSWCDSMDSRFPSEGFKTMNLCRNARRNFLRGVTRDYRGNEQLSSTRDSK